MSGDDNHPAETEAGNGHRMIAGSHERPGGPECNCGCPWSRWDNACTSQLSRLAATPPAQDPAETEAGSRCANCDHTDDDHGARGSGVPGPRACRRDGPDCDCWGYIAPDPRASPPAQGPAETERRPMRVGRKLGRTLYCQHGADPSADDTFVGIMESEPLARRVVDCMNWLNGTAPAGPQAEGAGETAAWRERVAWARGVLGGFLDDSPLAGQVGQDVRSAIVTLSSDAHVRYAPKYPQPTGDPVLASARPAQAYGAGETEGGGDG